jgi:hypothetical protein
VGVLQDIDAELAALDYDLASGELALEAAERLRARVANVRERLKHADALWVGTTEAKRLIGVKSEHTIKAWARLGLLRSRASADGGIQVHLEDVLQRADEQRQLDDPAGTPMTQDEMDILAETRPGGEPWERTAPSNPSSSAA